MALEYKSLFNYGLEVDSTNRNLDFKTSLVGSEKQASLRLGYYSLTSLSLEIVRAMTEADSNFTYSVTIDRSIAGGTENRFTISTSGAFLSLLFSSGTRSASTVASLIGFPQSDYVGATSYTSQFSSGTTLIPSYIGYNWIPPELHQEVQGSRSISASGIKEAIVFGVMQFFHIEFKYEHKTRISEWSDLLSWASRQRVFEFIPEHNDTSIFYECTLEKSPAGQNGMGFQFKEMLPQFPNYYTTNSLTFRVTSR